MLLTKAEQEADDGTRAAGLRLNQKSQTRGCSGDEGVVLPMPYTRLLLANRSRQRRPAHTSAFVDVLCQPSSAIADIGLPSSALRSALRSACWVTAAPAIRWVAAVSGRGPGEVGMVTVTWRCSARWRAGSYGTPSCQQRHTIRHQPRPRVRIARGSSCPRARAAAYRSCAHGLWWRLVSA